MDVVASGFSSGMFGLEQYFLSTKAKTFELDRQRTLDLASNLNMRIDVLSSSLQDCNAGFSVPGLGYLSSTIFLAKMHFLVNSIVGPNIETICNWCYSGEFKADYPGAFHVIQTASSFLKDCDTVCTPYIDTFLNDWADAMFNTVALVTYVALIALGNPIAGSMGLVSLALISIKRAGYLPAFLEQPLSYLQFGADLYTLWAVPRFFLFKAFDVCMIALAIVNYATKNDAFNALRTSWFGDFTERKHKISEKGSLATFLQERGVKSHFPDFGTNEEIELFMKELDGFCKFSTIFDTNLSSVHAFSWDEPMTPAQQAELTGINPIDQLNRLEESCQTLGINIYPTKSDLSRFSEREKNIVIGWDRLNNFMRHNVIPDQVPANIEEFQKLIKMMMRSIEETADASDKKRKTEDLLVCCSGCVLAWTRDIEELLIPQSTDPAWRIHRELAKYRSERVSDLFLMINQQNPEVVQAMGDVGNAHMHSIMNAMVWHEWKSFRGEMCMQTHGRNLFIRYLQSAPITEDSPPEDVHGLVGHMSSLFDRVSNYFVPNKPDFSSFMKQHLSRSFVGAYYPAEFDDPMLSGMANALPIVYEKLFSSYTPAALVECIGTQIEMDHIPQPVVLNWIKQMQAKGVPMLSGSSNTGYDERFITTAPSPYRENLTIISLTPEGIRLLLWDLGIIGLRSQGEEVENYSDDESLS